MEVYLHLDMVRSILFFCSCLLLFACQHSIEVDEIQGEWIGKVLYSEEGDTLVFQQDRRPELDLTDSTFFFMNRWGKKFRGAYDLDRDYLLFHPTDSTTVANQVTVIYPDSFMVLRMSRDTVLLDVEFLNIKIVKQ